MSLPDHLSGDATLCAICQSPLDSGDNVTACPDCRAPYHTDCWQENQGCAVYGCSGVPPTEARQPLEMPVSYWGQDDKPCPSCRQTILAAAMRCRHCGATFSSARPESSTEYRHRSGRQERLPALRRSVVWLFICSALPCTAPLVAIFGGFWYASNRSDAKALRGIYAGLGPLSLALAYGQVVFIVVITVIYALSQN